MLNYDENGLMIFDRFEIDENLPKHGSKGEMNIQLGTGNAVWLNPSVNVGGTIRRIDASGQIVGDSDTIQLIAMNKDSFKEWLGRKLSKIGNKLTGSRRFDTKVVKENNAPTLTIEEFFKSIKNSKRQMEKIDDRIESYQAALSQADSFGQVALKEELLKKLDVVRSETQLYASNMVKVILEGQIVKFYKESEKGVRLDWIKNFTRTIPQKFVDVKVKLDELKIFDNYVIMHYDPNAQAYKMTEAEVEKAKDPILFGVIAGSRKLYFIGDWIDEYCDLTMDTLIDKFGKEAISKNNISTNIDIQI